MNPEMKNDYEQKEQVKNPNEKKDALLREYGYGEYKCPSLDYEKNTVVFGSEHKVFAEMMLKNYELNKPISIEGKTYIFSREWESSEKYYTLKIEKLWKEWEKKYLLLLCIVVEKCKLMV